LPGDFEFRILKFWFYTMGHKAVFLDRDGTVNEEMGYINHLERFRLLPRTGEAIRLLNEQGIKVVVITNQAGVARGYFSESLVHQVHQKMSDLLNEEGAYLDGIYYCPHHPDAGKAPYRQRCRCRKPQPGMIEQAVRDLDIDCSKSYMVGDRGIDIEFGRKVGTKTVLVLTGYGKGEWEYFGKEWDVRPDHVARDLRDAVQWILLQESMRRNSGG
jgi:D-glycero-D-manno-heptose 1,7-bisphosphate phosphatase